jgi:hypothetical protein
MERPADEDTMPLKRVCQSQFPGVAGTSPHRATGGSSISGWKVGGGAQAFAEASMGRKQSQAWLAGVPSVGNVAQGPPETVW